MGIVAIALGIWTATRGRRRLGWGAVAAGLLGIGLGILATRSGTGNLEAVFDATLIAQTFGLATPLVFGAIAGMFSERSGVINIGLEGMMLMGAFWGVYGSDKGGSWVVGLLVGMASGGLLALVYAYFAIHLRSDQIVGGTAVNFLALGITGYFFQQFYNGQVSGQVSTVPNLHIAGLGHFLETSIGDLSLLTWASFVLVIVSYVVLFKTPIGLRIRACGEHPRAADTVGINVYAIRYGCVVALGSARGARRRLPLARPAGERDVHLRHDERQGLHRPRRDDLRQLAPGGSVRGCPPVRLLERARAQAPGVLAQAATLFAILPYVLTLVAVAGVIGRTVAPAADGKPYAKQ